GILLAKFNNTNDVLFGTTTSGRNLPFPLESAIGLFINTIPLRVCWDQTTTYSSLMKKVQHDILEQQTLAQISLGKLGELCDHRGPLINHTFIFENYPLGNLDSSGQEFGKILSTRCHETSIFGLNPVAY